MQWENYCHHDVDIELWSTITEEKLLKPDDQLSIVQITIKDANRIIESDCAIGRDIVLSQVVQLFAVIFWSA
jgi:hypothetical protein